MNIMKDNRTIFKAYKNGHLILSTWTSSFVTEIVEKQAYQTRLNRGDFTIVYIHYSDSRSDETLLPR